MMSNPANQAVFLSYASQDAEAARRVCEALREAGVEVWFDQNELVGGDAWDAKIRRQILESTRRGQPADRYYKCEIGNRTGPKSPVLNPGAGAGARVRVANSGLTPSFEPNYSQGKLTADDYGRDHHPRCFTLWMAGAGVKPGFTYGATDDFGYNITENPVSVHDLQATILHQLGINHEALTYKHQGRYYRLTDVFGRVVRDVLV